MMKTFLIEINETQREILTSAIAIALHKNLFQSNIDEINMLHDMLRHDLIKNEMGEPINSLCF